MELREAFLASKLFGNGGSGGGETPVLETLSVAQNGEYVPDEGVTGWDAVNVNVPSLTDNVKSITIVNSTSLQIRFRCLPYKRTNKTGNGDVSTYIDNETTISANSSKTISVSAKGTAGGLMTSTGIVAFMMTTMNIPSGKVLGVSATSGTAEIIAKAGKKLHAVLYVDGINVFPATITLALEDSQAVV